MAYDFLTQASESGEYARYSRQQALQHIRMTWRPTDRKLGHDGHQRSPEWSGRVPQLDEPFNAVGVVVERKVCNLHAYGINCWRLMCQFYSARSPGSPRPTLVWVRNMWKVTGPGLNLSGLKRTNIIMRNLKPKIWRVNRVISEQ